MLEATAAAQITGSANQKTQMRTVITGQVFYDDNGNGIWDEGEKSPRHYQLRLFKYGTSCQRWEYRKGPRPPLIFRAFQSAAGGTH